MSLVMTQFGPIPRDMLEVKDEISEPGGSREIKTTQRF
jgi:hypothetical protein